MRSIASVAAFALLIAASSAPAFAAPPAYIQAPPLTQMSPAPVVGNVKAGPIELPIITWGGDIATIYANGNNRRTQKGSIFEREGLSVVLFREDDFTKQVRFYLEGRTPCLRGTKGMINMAAEIAARDPRTELVEVYHLTWSVGGDAFGVRGDIKTPKDLKGKTIAVQAYGPHVDYLFRVLGDAGLSPKDVTIKWTKELTGGKEDPSSALRQDKSVHAAMVIIPDALELTSQGTVGTGAEGSVKGAKILLTTKTASRIIADVYACRRDFYEARRSDAEKLVHALMLADEATQKVIREKSMNPAAYKALMTAAADILLDKPKDIAGAEGLYADAESVGYRGNIQFYTNPTNPRSSAKLDDEIQPAFIAMGLMSKRVPIQRAQWDYKRLAAGLADTGGVEVPRFDPKEVAKVIDTRQKQGTLSEGELFSFEVYFKPEQKSFSVEQYADAFKKAIDLAATYGGAVLTVEGHSDPLWYLQRKAKGATQFELSGIAQAAKNLSYARAGSVRQSIVTFAKARGVTLDDTQFTTIGHGIMQSKGGMCGTDPCAPKTEQEWRTNMRVEFRIIRVEAEASVFAPIGR